MKKALIFSTIMVAANVASANWIDDMFRNYFLTHKANSMKDSVDSFPEMKPVDSTTTPPAYYIPTTDDAAMPTTIKLTPSKTTPVPAAKVKKAPLNAPPQAEADDDDDSDLYPYEK